MLLKLDNVKTYYGNIRALKGISLEVAEGEIVCLIGGNGAGKSTLVNRLYGKTIQATDSISSRVGKGKHTNTTRD